MKIKAKVNYLRPDGIATSAYGMLEFRNTGVVFNTTSSTIPGDTVVAGVEYEPAMFNFLTQRGLLVSKLDGEISVKEATEMEELAEEAGLSLIFMKEAE